MKTISFNKAGNPIEVLEVEEKPIPTPGEKELLIKMIASPINPSDGLFIEGVYRLRPEFPHQTAGLEGTGIVEKAGRHTNMIKGTLVAFFYKNAWSEYVIVPENKLIALPGDFPIDKAAQFCLNPFTAWGLLECANANAGDWLLITAGNSGVSRIAIQLAKRKNIKVITSVRDIKQAESLYALGADAVLDSEAADFSEQVSTITSKKGVNIAFEAVGGKIGDKVVQSLAPFGRMMIYGLLTNEATSFFNSQLLYKYLTISGFGIRAFLANQGAQQRREMIDTLITEIRGSSLKLPIVNEFAFGEFKEAWTAYLEKGAQSKIVFKIS